jgi:hypothetical protein
MFSHAQIMIRRVVPASPHGRHNMNSVVSRGSTKKIERPVELDRRRLLQGSAQISTGAIALAGLGFPGIPYILRARAQSSLPSVDVWVSVGSTEFLFAGVKGRKLAEGARASDAAARGGERTGEGEHPDRERN